MDKEENMSVVRKFKDAVLGKLSLSRLILFGSRARGDFKEDSDFDLIIVSDDFEGVKSYERGGELRMDWGYDYSVDMICLTNSEFNKVKDNRQTVIGLAVREGVEI